MTDKIAAWCVDGAVLWFGIKIENLLNERVNKGTQKEPKWEDRYTLAQLLDPLFHPPKPLPALTTMSAANGLAAFLAMANQPGSGIKRWEYVKPS